MKKRDDQGNCPRPGRLERVCVHNVWLPSLPQGATTTAVASSGASGLGMLRQFSLARHVTPHSSLSRNLAKLASRGGSSGGGGSFSLSSPTTATMASAAAAAVADSDQPPQLSPSSSYESRMMQQPPGSPRRNLQSMPSFLKWVECSR